MSILRMTVHLIALLVAIVTATISTISSPADASLAAAFTRFYASTPLPDRSLESFPSSWAVPINPATLQWLSLLPTWNTTTKKINNSAVVFPHADEVVAVRVLGGWDAGTGNCNASCDIVYRATQTGALAYRWHLLDQRLDHFVWFYQLRVMLVLDNVPYALVKQPPALGPFGQDAPPKNMTEWRGFVKAVMEHIVARYGKEMVEQRFRVRVGTEPDGPRYSQCPGGKPPCSTTPYFESYVNAAMAVKSVSPKIACGAGNWLHQSSDFEKDTFFEKEFYQRVGELELKQNLPHRLVDFVGQSDYVQGSQTNGLRLPAFIQSGANAMANFAGIYKQSGLPSSALVTDLEIMEFAPLENVDDQTSVEPGSFGASFYVAMWATALSSSVKRVFHWGSNREPGVHGELWTALGWCMGMADVLVGRPIVSVDTPSSLMSGIYKLVASNATLATAFDPNRRASRSPSLKFTLTHDVNSAIEINPDVSPFDNMLAEAEQQGFTEHDDGLPYGINKLLNAQGKKWIREPSVWAHFMRLQQQTFSRNKVSYKAGEEYPVAPFTTVLLMQ